MAHGSDAVTDRIAQAIRDAVAGISPTLAGVRPVGVGWATVDLDRCVADLAAELGTETRRFMPASRSPVLGCTCRVAAGLHPDGVAIAVVEPDTEGRLAASLAHGGEGPVAVWFGLGDDEGPTARDGNEGRAARPDREGPFGPERLLGIRSVRGPHRLLVGSAAGTIRA